MVGGLFDHLVKAKTIQQVLNKESTIANFAWAVLGTTGMRHRLALTLTSQQLLGLQHAQNSDTSSLLDK